MKLEKNNNRISIINDGVTKKEQYSNIKKKKKSKLTQQDRNAIVDDFLTGKLVYENTKNN